MLLRFADLASIVRGLEQGIIPAGLARQPVAAAFTPSGACWVELRRAPSSLIRAGLDTLGGEASSSETCPPLQPYPNWFALLPLEGTTDAALVETPPAALFAVRQAAQAVRLAAEGWRLGATRMRLLVGQGPPGTSALLWMESPPSHCLRWGGIVEAGGGPQVFVEQASRVWVEWGYRHRFASQMSPAAKRWLLLACHSSHVLPAPASAQWAPMELWLPWCPRRWQDRSPRWQLSIPLQLRATPASRSEAPRLWVVDGGEPAFLSEWVATIAETTLERLEVALGQWKDRQVAVLRSRARVAEPPILVLPAQACGRLLRLEQCFVPVGHELVPLPRRDIVRDYLGGDAEVVTWLRATAGQLEQHCIPQAAFRRLGSQVEYVQAQPARALRPWRVAEAFPLERFSVPEEVCPLRQSAGMALPELSVEVPFARTSDLPEIRKGATPARPEPPAVPEELPSWTTSPDSTSVALAQLLALERRFLAIEGSLEAPERQELWRELARLHSNLEHDLEVTLCWLHRLWPQSSLSVNELATWQEQLGGEVAVFPLTASSLAELAAAPDRSQARARRLVLALLRAGQLSPRPTASVLAQADQVLALVEPFLPIRAVWLARCALYQLGGQDILALTRARDRLLQRLHAQGMDPDKELPGFLRLAATASGGEQTDAQRLRRVHAMIAGWRRDPAWNDALSLLLAVGFARLGESETAHEQLARIRKLPAARGVSAAASWVQRALVERTEQSLAGRRGVALSAELLRQWQLLPESARLEVDRLRQVSRILEPYERIDPYRGRWRGRLDSFGELLERAFRGITPEDAFASYQGLRQQANTPRQRYRLLGVVFAQAFFLGELAAEQLLEDLLGVLDDWDGLLDVSDLQTWGNVFETGLALAGHYDLRSLFAECIKRLEVFVARLRKEQSAWLIGAMTTPLFRVLKRLGHEEASAALLQTWTERMLEGQSLPTFLQLPGLNRQAIYPGLLRLAGGWWYFDWETPVKVLLQAVRQELFHPRLSANIRPGLACAYIHALGQAPPELAEPLLEELCQQGASWANDFTLPNRFRLLDTTILALSADPIRAQGRVRRLLDEDEFLIRRRIHQDLRAALSEAGF